LYAFGYGLSYTTFAYANFQLHNQTIIPHAQIVTSVELTNTGNVTGDEVVELYIQHINSSVVRPEKELKAFQRITLKPGEKKTVKLQFDTDNLSYWDEDENRWVLEKDKVKIMIGSSSDNIKFSKMIE
jgi:beta-glucosidase